MDNIVKKSKKVMSFIPNDYSSDYTLELVESRISQTFSNLVAYLQSIPQVYLCLRGDSFSTESKHNRYLSEDLLKVFVVGAKARVSIGQSADKIFQHYGSTDSLELANLIDLGNYVINNIPDSHPVRGLLKSSLFDKIKVSSEDEQKKWKAFILSVLHNEGRCKEFKKHSPFISLTYGYKKIDIAKYFSVGRSSFKKGIIYIYSLNSGWPYYIRTIDMTRKLKSLGIDWYDNIHQEIILLNGMYPHFMLGICEVSYKGIERTIINPWLNKLLIDGRDLDILNGLPIDQTNFAEYAADLNYSRYFYHYMSENTEYTSILGKYESDVVFRI